MEVFLPATGPESGTDHTLRLPAVDRQQVDLEPRDKIDMNEAVRVGVRELGRPLPTARVTKCQSAVRESLNQEAFRRRPTY